MSYLRIHTSKFTGLLTDFTLVLIVPICGVNQGIIITSDPLCGRSLQCGC